MTVSQPPPLTGITVVSLEHAIAAPYCSRQLAELGARVIKVERRTGGDFARHYDARAKGQSSHFIWTNRGKQSMTLDLKHAEAGSVLRRLLTKSDILLQNLAPGSARRLGLDWHTLRVDLPRLIVCNISGYGDAGPYRNRKAYDLLVQAEAGLLSVTGTPEAPAKSGISIADIAAGTQALSAILAALLHRGRTGEGCEIEVSMLEALAEWMGYPLYFALDGQPPPPRSGADHASIYPYGAFATGDGAEILLGIQNEREWQSLCEEILARPDLASDTRFENNSARSAHRDALKPILEECFAAFGAVELGQRLDRAGIAWASLNDMAAVWSHPQLAALQSFTTIDAPGGQVPALRPPARNNRFTTDPGPVPAVGEHTDAILRGAGYSDEEIAGFRENGVI